MTTSDLFAAGSVIVERRKNLLARGRIEELLRGKDERIAELDRLMRETVEQYEAELARLREIIRGWAALAEASAILDRMRGAEEPQSLPPTFLQRLERVEARARESETRDLERAINRASPCESCGEPREMCGTCPLGGSHA